MGGLGVRVGGGGWCWGYDSRCGGGGEGGGELFGFALVGRWTSQGAVRSTFSVL